ncbi:MAG: hypothetical protein CMO20_03850 [Thermoplasmata archaeon]|nr:hypothetical protein [Thermoplasmata archaeon]
MLTSVLTPLLLSNNLDDRQLKNDEQFNSATINSTELVTISSYPTGISNSFKLDIPENEAVRNISLELKPNPLSRSNSHSFTAPNDFNQSGATSQGVDFNSSGLQVSAIDEYWSFDNSNNLPTGWSSTNTYYGGINTMNCGTNGSGGRSLMLRHSTATVTSNVIDLSSLSSGIMAFWMTEGRSGCGEDPDGNENLFVEYKKSSGSWGSITTYYGYQGYPGYTNRNDQFNLPNDAFHSNFQFRFRFPYGSGTCCDWWFVDDVRLTKPGGQGNWTTPAFGPSATNANYRSLPGPYGTISIDTDAPTNAVSWTAINASDDAIIDGYDQRTEKWADLGGIDWTIYPSIRLKITLTAQGTGSVTKVNGVHIQGTLVNNFDDNPTDWSLSSCSWDGDSITGTGMAITPTILSRRPISKITSAITYSGGGIFQASLDGGSWITLNSNGVTELDSWFSQIQFRLNGQNSNFDLQRFEVELHGAGLPESPKFDLSSNGRNEWGIVNQSIGTWGWQDILEDGNHSVNLKFPNQHSIPFWIPKGLNGDFVFEISPDLSSGVTDLGMELMVGGNLISSWYYGSGDESQTFRMQLSDKTSFINNVDSTSEIWADSGVEYVQAEMVLDATSGGARFGGIAIPHQPEAFLSYEPESDFVMGLNNIASSMTANNGLVTIPLSMTWEYPASMEVTFTELNTGLGAEIELENASNLSATLTPSWQWFEFGHNISVIEGELAALRYDLVGENNAITYTVWLGAGNLPPNTIEGDSHAIILPNNFSTGTYSTPPGANGVGICCELHPLLQFSLNASWEDEEILSLSLRGIMKNGLISLPWVHTFGMGPLQGVENDVFISDWKVFNDHYLEIPEESSYLKSDSNITIEVDLKFENLESAFAPRSGDVQISLLENGIVKLQTTELNQGKAVFETKTPMASENVEYSIQMTLLSSADDVTTIGLNRTFVVDSISPIVINQSVKPHDHLEPSLAQTLTFELSDEPVLPTDATLMLWKEWEDDDDGDGEIDAEEFVPKQLNLPSNLSHERGNYTYIFDDTYGNQGDFVAGYIIGTDPAGNRLLNGGNETNNSHLFVYQLMTDEAPMIYREGAMWLGGTKDWLHPSPTYSLLIPFDEYNGYSDVDQITINLAGNSEENKLAIHWGSFDESCSTSSQYIVSVNCTIRAREGNISPFTNEMEIEINFTLDWSLPSEDNLRREPDIEIIDRAGQGDWIALPDLRWRFSTDIEILSDSIQIQISEGKVSGTGAWVAPNSNIIVTGKVVFSPTGDEPVDQIKVMTTLDDNSLTTRTENGWWENTIKSPRSTSEPIPLSFELTDLPAQARDVTDSGMSTLYITVDKTPPIPVEVVGPRLTNEIRVSSLSSLIIELKINEMEQLDVETLKIHWIVTHGSNHHGDKIANGENHVTLPGHNAAGSAIPIRSTIDLESVITEERLTEELSLHIWISGQDMVGQQMVSDVQFNSETNPFASWQIQQLKSNLIIEDSDLSFSHNGELDLGDTILITVTVHNTGEVHGTALINLDEVNSKGERTLVTNTPTSIGVYPGDTSEAYIEWTPENAGRHHVVVIMNGDDSATGIVINVVEVSNSGIISSLDSKGFTIEWLGILGSLFIILTLVVIVGIRSKGNNTEDIWHENNPEESIVDESQYNDEIEAYNQYLQQGNYQNQQITQDQYVQWQQYTANQQQQQMTNEQYAQWQQWAAWQQQYYNQEGWSDYQQAQYDYGQNQ